jgi:hypothetical protein
LHGGGPRWWWQRQRSRVLRKHFMCFESMRVFIYAHDITERDQANIVHIESLLFNLKWKGVTKQMKKNDFLCTFFDLVNKYRQIWSFLLILCRLPHLSFSRIHCLFFRPWRKQWIEVHYIYIYMAFKFITMTCRFGTRKWGRDSLFTQASTMLIPFDMTVMHKTKAVMRNSWKLGLKNDCLNWDPEFFQSWKFETCTCQIYVYVYTNFSQIFHNIIIANFARWFPRYMGPWDWVVKVYMPTQTGRFYCLSFEPHLIDRWTPTLLDLLVITLLWRKQPSPCHNIRLISTLILFLKFAVKMLTQLFLTFRLADTD